MPTDSAVYSGAGGITMDLPQPIFSSRSCNRMPLSSAFALSAPARVCRAPHMPSSQDLPSLPCVCGMFGQAETTGMQQGASECMHRSACRQARVAQRITAYTSCICQ